MVHDSRFDLVEVTIADGHVRLCEGGNSPAANSCRPTSIASLPSTNRHIQTVMAGIRWVHGRPPAQKEAILPGDVLDMLETPDRGPHHRAADGQHVIVERDWLTLATLVGDRAPIGASLRVECRGGFLILLQLAPVFRDRLREAACAIASAAVAECALASTVATCRTLAGSASATRPKQ